MKIIRKLFFLNFIEYKFVIVIVFCIYYNYYNYVLLFFGNNYNYNYGNNYRNSTILIYYYFNYYLSLNERFLDRPNLSLYRGLTVDTLFK